MIYSIERDNSRKREDFDEYKYRIFRAGHLVASFWHDYRGDDHGLLFVDGTVESWPAGHMTDFLEGGGPQALRLTERAIRFLERHAK